MLRAAALACLPLAACGGSVPGSEALANGAVPAATPTPVAPASPVSLAGRWTGVEGTFLEVTPAGQPGAVRLEMQHDLDHRGTYDGRIVGDTIVFVRDGRELALRPSDGAATGLKWLDGKRDCLTVAPGEGYCRD